ncbi:hypothetical protein BVI061214_00410 [Thermus aquaticus]|uniref:Transposase IS4-like domain-containing protein n=1 Tax=Thermus aquaticus TaxID=271 RepID=A0A0M9ACN4_THEAQ|nr:hypothetical protein BVI061214_00410 [Thermus aquaticus]
MVEAYRRRWEVERFFRLLKTGLGLETLQLGGKLGLPSERDGPYLLLRGLVRLLNYEVTQELLKQAKGGRGRSFG